MLPSLFMRRSSIQLHRVVASGVPALPRRYPISHNYALVRRCSSSSGRKDNGKDRPSSSWRKYTFPAALGIACIGLVQARRKAKEHGIVLNIPFVDEALQRTKLALYRTTSKLAGKIARIELPFKWMRTGFYSAFAWVYGCKREEAALPLDSYGSLAQFFERELKRGVRQVDGHSEGGVVVSPVDAVLLCQGSARIDNEVDLDDVLIEQIKGITYSAGELVGKDPQGMNTKPRMLQYVVLYLAPGDYHRFHSPVDWSVLQRRHFGGDLEPVRPSAVRKNPGLYCKNERVVLNGTWHDNYYFGFAAVGALNVGSISIYFDETVRTNQALTRAIPRLSERNYAEDVKLKRGEMVGSFNFGSTIVLVFESSEEFQFTAAVGDRVVVGERLGVDQPQVPPSPTFFAPPWPKTVV